MTFGRLEICQAKLKANWKRGGVAGVAIQAYRLSLDCHAIRARDDEMGGGRQAEAACDDDKFVTDGCFSCKTVFSKSSIVQ
jgi:hypothetical protein